MCLIIFDWQPDSEEQLVLVGNRDEFYQRPSLAAHEWKQPSGIIAGKDIQAGGTWLGIADGRRVCTVTNYREVPSAQSDKSRGAIPVDFLSSDISAENFAKKLTMYAHEYTGFNALVFDGRQLVYVSNRSDIPWKPLEAGTYGLSNQVLNSPWPKLTRAKLLFQQVQSKADKYDNQAQREKAILDCMLDQQKPKDSELPDTGIGIDGERLLSTIFITSEHYGTRTSSLITTSKQGIKLTERNFSPSDKVVGTHSEPQYSEQSVFSKIAT